MIELWIVKGKNSNLTGSKNNWLSVSYAQKNRGEKKVLKNGIDYTLYYILNSTALEVTLLLIVG